MVDHLETAIYRSIKRFVERQSIVLAAMRDLRPDMFMVHEDKSSQDRKRTKAFERE
jgi:hypothetical protein